MSDDRGQITGVSPAAGGEAASLIEIETLLHCSGWFWIVGAVFNRDYPGNRGCKPLPPTI